MNVKDRTLFIIKLPFANKDLKAAFDNNDKKNNKKINMSIKIFTFTEYNIY